MTFYHSNSSIPRQWMIFNKCYKARKVLLWWLPFNLWCLRGDPSVHFSSSFVNTFDKYVTRHDQTRLDVIKCGYACMEGAFVSDLWWCQSKINNVFFNTMMFKRCGSHDHNVVIVWEASPSPVGCSNKLGKFEGILTNYRCTHNMTPH